MPPTVTLTLVDCEAWAEVPQAHVLSADEHARASRFRHDADRRRFIVRRGLLRRLLGERMRLPPEAVPLRAGPNGKPLLVSDSGASLPRATESGEWPAFNLSRSGPLALYAIVDVAPEHRGGARIARAIGVDLERVERGRRTLEDLLRIAGHFTPEESRRLRSLDGDEAVDAFYRLWTCKEACLKCLGTGIGSGTVALDDIRCIVGPDGAIERADCAVGAVAWHLRGVEPCPGHVAAVALPDDADPFDIVLHRLEPTPGERA